MANKLPLERRIEVTRGLCQGNSIRHTARITGVAINTIRRFLKELAPDPLALTPKNTVNLIAQLETREIVAERRAKVRRELQTGCCSRCGNVLMPLREVSGQGAVDCLACPLCGEVIFKAEPEPHSAS